MNVRSKTLAEHCVNNDNGYTILVARIYRSKIYLFPQSYITESYERPFHAQRHLFNIIQKEKRDTNENLTTICNKTLCNETTWN